MLHHKITNTAYKEAILFCIGGIAYYMTEVLWRGYSHWTMALLGGFIFVLVGSINEFLSWKTPIWLQGIYGSFCITLSELIVGYVINIKMGLDVWDYSTMPLNFMGQICVPFSLAWIIVSIIAIILDDYLRYFLFGEEKPRYKLK